MTFTMVFDGEISFHKRNPFTVETPYGIPVIVSKGDATERCDILREALTHYACPGLPKCTERKLKDGSCLRELEGTCGRFAAEALALEGNS